MPEMCWQLIRGRPRVQIMLTLAPGAPPLTRNLLAHTRVGSRHAQIDLVLDENDCLLCGTSLGQAITLGGA
jgi:hypothetical protein